MSRIWRSYRVVAVTAVCVTWAATAGVRPYEMEWAGRTKDDRPATLPLVSADGWTCSATNAEATVSTARERVLFGDGSCIWRTVWM